MIKKLTSVSSLAAIVAGVLCFGLTSCDNKGGGSASGGGAGDANKEDHAFEFPKPEFAGTPIPAQGIPNLEPAGTPPKLKWKLTKGATNLAKGKPVEYKGSPSIGEAKQITDGDKAGQDGSFVELGIGLESITIDLGASASIDAVLVWHTHKQTGLVMKDVIVEISDDAAFTTSKQIYNCDDDNSAGKGAGKDYSWVQTNHGRLMDAKGAKGRYVRLWSNGNNVDELNRYTEVEVWGTAAK